MNKEVKRTRHKLLSLVILVALLAMFPVSAFACHMNWVGSADCDGFYLGADNQMQTTVYIKWYVELKTTDGTLVERHPASGWGVSPNFNHGQTWTHEVQWNTNLNNGRYRAEIHMQAYYTNGNYTYQSYNKIVEFDCPCNCKDPVEFDEFDLAAGQEVSDQWAANWGMHIASNLWDHPPVIFDSSVPTCGDTDLGSPNQAWCADGSEVLATDPSCTAGPGPGVGSAGVTTNKFALDNVLIIDERWDGCTPDDLNGAGTIIFTFDTPVPIWTLKLLDMDHSGGTVEAFGADDNPVILPVSIPNTGDNGYLELEINAHNVTRLEIHYQLGAVAAILFCEPYTPPTAVDLASFDAQTTASSITLNWETASELDNLGFNIYRAEAADGAQAQINVALIPSQNPGSPAGASYQFVDDTASAGATYYYWLEAVDVYGQTNLHGPVSAARQLVQRTLIRPRLDAGLTKK